MGKEILMVLGSPRRNGNSDQMAEAFIRGAERMGHRVTKICTESMETGCCGCGGCYGSEDRPCCQHPDFNQVAASVLRADGVVFAAPLYWSGIPGKMKCFIDNMFCFYAAGKDLARKKTAMLCVGHAEDYMMFDGVQRTFELIAKTVDWSIAGQVYVQGVLDAGDVQKTDGLKRCEELGGRFFS